jgi:hypothetical protein
MPTTTALPVAEDAMPACTLTICRRLPHTKPRKKTWKTYEFVTTHHGKKLAALRSYAP